MKNIDLKKWILAIFSIMLVSSCVDVDMNRDPHKSSQLDPNMQITTTQMFFTSSQDSYHRYMIFPGGWLNQLGSEYSVVFNGGAGKKHYDYMKKLWEELYPNVIVNTVDVIERTKDDPEMVNVHAAARVIRVQNFLRLTDYYGDVPYFDAGKAYYTGQFFPKYDNQSAIYADFFKELTEAVAQFDPSKPTLTADLYFDGDIDKWKKFANSLHLRIALRLIKVDPSTAQSEATKAISAGVMTSNGDICFVKHEDVSSQQRSAGNGIANRFHTGSKNQEHRVNRELIGYMEDSKDPRLLWYAGSYLEDGTNKTRTDITEAVKAYYGSYRKMCVYGQEYRFDVAGSTSLTVEEMPGEIEITQDGKTIKVLREFQTMQPSKMISEPGSPFIHMSYAEVEFLKADADLRFNGGAGAASYFKAGLEAAVRQWTLFGASVDEAALSAFIAANPLSSDKDLALEQVNTQLWVLHFMDPLETWSNVRRTGMPADLTKFANKHPSMNESSGEAPRRMPYPLSEQLNNSKVYQEALDNMEVDVHPDATSKDDWRNRIWWDKK